MEGKSAIPDNPDLLIVTLSSVTIVGAILVIGLLGLLVRRNKKEDRPNSFGRLNRCEAHILHNYNSPSVVTSPLIPSRTVGERLAVTLGKEEKEDDDEDPVECNSIYHEPWLERKGSYDLIHHYENILPKSRTLIPDPSR